MVAVPQAAIRPGGRGKFTDPMNSIPGPPDGRHCPAAGQSKSASRRWRSSNPGLMGGEDYPASTGDICSGWTTLDGIATDWIALDWIAADAYDGSSDPEVRAEAVSLPMMVQKLAVCPSPIKPDGDVRTAALS